MRAPIRVCGVGLCFVGLLSCSDDTAGKDSGPGKDGAAGKDRATAPVERGTLWDRASVEATRPDGAGSAISFSAKVQPVFDSTCATSGCHAGAAPQAGLNLSAGASHAALVNVASSQCATLKRVLPGDPGKSYLMIKLAGAGTCFTGQKMPVGGALQGADRASISGWIQAGAPSN